MEASNLKNMIVLKNLPSNIVEEAIIVLKTNNKVKKLEKVDKTETKEIQRKTSKSELKNNEYVTKEAELLVSNYITRLENKNNKNNKNKKNIKK